MIENFKNRAFKENKKLVPVCFALLAFVFQPGKVFSMEDPLKPGRKVGGGSSVRSHATNSRARMEWAPGRTLEKAPSAPSSVRGTPSSVRVAPKLDWKRVGDAYPLRTLPKLTDGQLRGTLAELEKNTFKPFVAAPLADMCDFFRQVADLSEKARAVDRAGALVADHADEESVLRLAVEARDSKIRELAASLATQQAMHDAVNAERAALAESLSSLRDELTRTRIQTETLRAVSRRGSQESVAIGSLADDFDRLSVHTRGTARTGMTGKSVKMDKKIPQSLIGFVYDLAAVGDIVDSASFQSACLAGMSPFFKNKDESGSVIGLMGANFAVEVSTPTTMVRPIIPETLVNGNTILFSSSRVGSKCQEFLDRVLPGLPRGEEMSMKRLVASVANILVKKNDESAKFYFYDFTTSDKEKMFSVMLCANSETRAPYVAVTRFYNERAKDYAYSSSDYTFLAAEGAASDVGGTPGAGAGSAGMKAPE